MPRAALALVLLTACAASASGSASSSSGSGTMSPGTGSEGKPAHVAGGQGTPGATPDGGASAGGAGATAQAGAPVGDAAPCQNALAEAPTSLFGTRMILRLPKGVELVEQNPFYAVAAAPNLPTSCGQAVSYAASGFFEYPGTSAVTTVRDLLMELRGLPAAGLTWDDEGSRGRTYTGAYSAAADAAKGTPAVRGWLVLREAGDKYAYFTLFEADPAVWDAVKPIFVASGKSLVIKPRPLQASTPVSAGTPPATGGTTGTTTTTTAAGTTAPASGGGISAQPTSGKKKKAK